MHYRTGMIMAALMVVCGGASWAGGRAPLKRGAPPSSPSPKPAPKWVIHEMTEGVESDFYLDISDRDFLKDIKVLAGSIGKMIGGFAAMFGGGEMGGDDIEKTGQTLLRDVRRVGVVSWEIDSPDAVNDRFTTHAKRLESQGWRLVLKVRSGEGSSVCIYAFGDRQGLIAMGQMSGKPPVPSLPPRMKKQEEMRASAPPADSDRDDDDSADNGNEKKEPTPWRAFVVQVDGFPNVGELGVLMIRSFGSLLRGSQDDEALKMPEPPETEGDADRRDKDEGDDDHNDDK